MTDEVPFLPNPEDTRKTAVELYEYLRSIASDKGTLFFTTADIGQMFDHGEEALTILRDAGLVVFEVTNHLAREMWKLPELIDLRNKESSIRQLIDLRGYPKETTDESISPQFDPARDP